MTVTDPAASGFALHLGIAEQGKLYALAGDHPAALFHYREAMRIVVKERAPEVFFRHYLECVMESLELLGSYDDVLTYCERALLLFDGQSLDEPLVRKQLAALHQRRGAVLTKAGRVEEARRALEQALHHGTAIQEKLPLAEALLSWLRSGLRVAAARVTDEQKRTHYFSVRRDTVDEKRAIRLQPSMDPAAAWAKGIPRA